MDGIKILFLSADTGGGHRASAESLANQFQILFPGSTYDLLDVISLDTCMPYNKIGAHYKHLSAHPRQWKLVYEVTNSRAVEIATDLHIKLACEPRIRSRIKSYNPDVVVSVHPMMNGVPAAACKKISLETGKHLPMFTVVTDLGSCHSLWFSSAVEKIFIASEQIRNLAINRGRIPEDKLIQSGLPIRHDFAVQAEKLGDRNSADGQAYQLNLRENLGIRNVDYRTVLVMGGGEGVGSLSAIVDALFIELSKKGIDATILVVCGRNEKLKKDLDERDWDVTVSESRLAKELPNCWAPPIVISPSSGCIDQSITNRLRRVLSSRTKLDAVASPLPAELSTDEDEEDDEVSVQQKDMIEQETAEYISSFGRVDVIGLGFVTNMAEYMAASDVLVTKAGPGTIAEAAAVGLPVMLTSFLPGQEEGNADFVIEKQFGALVPDYDPTAIADEVCDWLSNEGKLADMSRSASVAGVPLAAKDIARKIGQSTIRWRELNETEAVINV
mmetsp:Transcript_33076/g.47841  ORF Transcript_33076/g.47841 Transcript_33076/m.47841 type:complete len:501 (-) Transcript_33076:305-1807(-)